MSTDVHTLATQPREQTGSRAARRERRAGRVPLNLYGHGEENRGLLVDGHELGLALARPGRIFTLQVDGRDEPVMLKEVQYDIFGHDVLHVDFERIDLTEEVEVEVALEFIGTPVGVAQGGTVMVHHNTLWLKCIASSVPDVLTVDISAVEMGHALHAGEIPLPAGIKLDTAGMDADTQILGVLAPRAPEEAPSEEAAVPAEGAAEGEKKPEGDEKKEKAD